jgi:glyoxylase-like metal-dependent hydrolase (beta-lactamase superfamily II)
MTPVSEPVSAPDLPSGLVLLERGWLSSNNIFLSGPDDCALIDSGYASHADQTVQLVGRLLQGRPLSQLVNTHLHSDHCGGNAALQAQHPQLQTWIPPGLAEQVRDWDPVALSYVPTGQHCPRFNMQGVLRPGMAVTLGQHRWQVHGAPGHDPDAIMLFEPQTRLLISADALWGNGFGVVFPELDGEDAFEHVAATLDVIERLNPLTVIPGHGALFTDVADALARARRRLDQFVQHPHKHARYAAKVLLKFKLLEAQSLTWSALLAWAQDTSLLRRMQIDHDANQVFETWLGEVLDELVASGAAQRQGSLVANA